MTALAAQPAAPSERYLPTLVQFENSMIDGEAFDHYAHVYVGWQLLNESSMLEAIERFVDALKSLTKKLGAEGKYHETITWFYIIEIAERMQELPSGDWDAFAAANTDLLADSRVLKRAYSAQRLMSDVARKQFLLPDHPDAG